MKLNVTFPRHEVPSSEPQLKKIIRDIGIKVTHQRMAILQQILKGKDHVTAQEVFEKVRQSSPEIGFATVYRFLRTLCDHKILSEVRMKGLPARYEWAKKSHHDHLTCTDCGMICEFESLEIERAQDEIALRFGFVLNDHIMELYGLCANCQNKVQ